VPNYRTTVYWNQSVMGVSETYITPNVSIGVLGSLISSLLAKRFAMLFTNDECVGVRVSNYSATRRSFFLIPGVNTVPGIVDPINVPERGALTITPVTRRPDQIRACLQERIYYDVDRSTTRYLAGIPDSVTVYEPGSVNVAADAAWLAAYNDWSGFLVGAGFQIRAQDKSGASPVIPVQHIVRQSAEPGLIGVSIPTAAVPGVLDERKVHLTGFKRVPRYLPSMNGNFFVESINTTLIPDEVVYFLRGTAGQDPSTFKILGTLQRVHHVLYPITAIRTVRTGIHKRGRPSPAPRGRRLTRTTLDP